MLEKVLIESSYRAFCVNGHIFRETVYGVVKRLHYLWERIESYRQQRQLTKEQIRILDVGCGTGVSITIPLAKNDYFLVGLDLDQASIERARQIAQGLENIEFHCLELGQLTITTPFDIVICSEVFEHLIEPAQLLQQIHQVLLEDGLLLITVPNGYGYFEAERFIEEHLVGSNSFTDKLQHRLVYKFGSKQLKLRHIEEWKPEHYQLAWSSMAPDQSHYQHFTMRQLKALLTAGRFELLECQNRTFLAGNILHNFVRDWDDFLKWNCEVADWLPHWACSGWMITARCAKAI